MTFHTIRKRATSASLSLALTAGLVAAGAAVAPTAAAESGDSSTVDTSYLSDALGLASDTVIETVTYDRFQWLLQQPGQFALLVGSTQDEGFAARAADVDAAAKASGASRVYWFDPNLSGLEGEKGLDTRAPESIAVAGDAQPIFGKVWQNLIGQYLGNGVSSVPASNRASVTITADDSVVNDAHDPVWDFRSAAEPAAGDSDAVFLVYDKDRTHEGSTDRVVDWVNLSTSDAVGAELSAALESVGGAQIDQIGQFEWWEDSANAKHDLAYPDDARYGGDILEAADAEDGWRVQQVTYPELLHLLELREEGANIVILFGGTWCHNTRAVLKQLNAEAQGADVPVVYNFDLVLDGGTVNGSNGSANPIHVRDPAARGSSTDFRPSHLYGDVVNRYFPNLVTQYEPTSNSRVDYYPAGDNSADLSVARKLQVPFLVEYERGTGEQPAADSVKRQWIQQNVVDGATSYTEYMTEWWFTNPSPQLGLNFPIPADEATLTDPQRLQLDQARARLDFGQEALVKLTDFFGGVQGPVTPYVTLEAPAVRYGTSPRINVEIAVDGDREVSGDVALVAEGKTYTSTVADGAATFTLDVLAAGTYQYTVSYDGSDLVAGFERSGEVTVAPREVSDFTVSGTVSGGTAQLQFVASGPDGLADPTGSVTATLTNGTDELTTQAQLNGGRATASIPVTGDEPWEIAASYEGDANYLSATATSTTGPRPGNGEDGNGNGGGGDDDEGGGATINVASTTLTAGSAVPVTVTGLDVSWIEVGIESEYQRLGTADVVGDSAELTVTIPEDIDPGLHRLVVLDSNGDELASLDVTILAAADGALSDTGAGDSLRWALASAVLVSAGLALAVGARRRAMA